MLGARVLEVFKFTVEASIRPTVMKVTLTHVMFLDHVNNLHFGNFVYDHLVQSWDSTKL